MIMNETGNVYGAVLRDYSKLFTKLNKLGKFMKNEFIYGGHLLSIGAVTISLATMGLAVGDTFQMVIYVDSTTTFANDIGFQSCQVEVV